DVSLYEAMYHMSLNQPIMKPSLFHTHIAWPGDKPQSGEGACTSGAGAGADGDDEDVDNTAADAFEDNDDEMQDD
ncbi:hypothetical protein A2U01_0080813, partial [Trifolium medium]|nr:hypothetical protein [Trifolium medium]